MAGKSWLNSKAILTWGVPPRALPMQTKPMPADPVKILSPPGAFPDAVQPEQSCSEH